MESNEELLESISTSEDRNAFSRPRGAFDQFITERTLLHVKGTEIRKWSLETKGTNRLHSFVNTKGIQSKWMVFKRLACRVQQNNTPPTISADRGYFS